jgi:hypothetical protein
MTLDWLLVALLGLAGLACAIRIRRAATSVALYLSASALAGGFLHFLFSGFFTTRPSLVGALWAILFALGAVEVSTWRSTKPRPSPRRRMVVGGAFVLWVGSIVFTFYGDCSTMGPGLGSYLRAFPVGAKNLRMHHASAFLEDGTLQVRFDLPATALPELERHLGCVLGPPSQDRPSVAVLGTNDRFWYRPDLATRHRACQRDNSSPFSVLVDLSPHLRRDRAIVYLLVAH